MKKIAKNKSRRHRQRDYLAASDLRGFSLNVLGIVATLMGTAGALAVTQKPQQSTPPVDSKPSETPVFKPPTPTPILTPPLAQSNLQLHEKRARPSLLPERSTLEFSNNRPALDPLLSEIRQSLGRSNFQPQIIERERVRESVPAQLRSHPFPILPTASPMRPEMTLKSTQPLPTQKGSPMRLSQGQPTKSQELIPQPTLQTSPRQEQSLRLALSDVVVLALEKDISSKNAYLERLAQGQNVAPHSAIAISLAEFNSDGRTRGEGAGTKGNRVPVEMAQPNKPNQIQPLRATLSDKITEAILAYRELQRVQEGLKIEQQSLVLVQAIPAANRAARESAIANRQLAISEAQQRLAAAKLALLDILDIEGTLNPIAAETPTAQSVTLNAEQLQQLAFETQPNSPQGQKNRSHRLPIRDEIRNVQLLFSQVAQAHQGTASSRSQLQSEWEKQRLGQGGSLVELVRLQEELVRSRHAELNTTIDYLKALAQLERSAGQTLDTWQVTVEPGEI